MSTSAPSRPLTIPKITVCLHRRADRTIYTTYPNQADQRPGRDTGLLTSHRIRSLDEAKQRINRRLAPFTSNIEYVDPPGEGASIVFEKE